MEPTEKRFCPQCGAELEVDARFCSECGVPLEEAPQVATSQRTPRQSPPSTQQVLATSGAEAARIAQNLSQHFFTQMGSVLRWEKLAYIGIGMTAISVILPLVSISLFAPATAIVAFSQGLSFILLALSVFGGYYASEGKYSIPISLNIGILATFSVIYFKLHSLLGDAGEKLKDAGNLGLNQDARLAMTLMKEYADKIVGMGLGVYFLLGGALIVMFACAACRLTKKNEPVNIGNVCNEVKSAVIESVEIGGQSLPGFVISIIVVLMLIFLVSNIEIFGFKVSNLI